MKLLRSLSLAVALVAAAAVSATAQTGSRTASVSVRAEILAVQGVALSGDARLSLRPRAAGQAPSRARDASTSYSIATNGGGNRIVASLQDASLPEGITLEVSLAAPGTGTSAGMRALTSGQAVPVVTEIGRVSAAGVPITYQLTAAADAAASRPDVLNVHFTILSDDVN